MVKNWRQGTSAEEIINFTTTAIIATNNHQKWGGGGVSLERAMSEAEQALVN